MGMEKKVTTEDQRQREEKMRIPVKDRCSSECGAGWVLIFTYGTLKKGFSNHVLMLDLIAGGDAVYLGACRTAERYPLVCGPYRVPFLLNMSGCGERVCGEMYAVTAKGLNRMDELEGTSKGHYERLPIKVMPSATEERENEDEVEVQAYFGHRSYALDLWRRNGEKGFHVYSEKEARGYIRRKDRPQNLTFLDQIKIFISSPAPPQLSTAVSSTV